MLHNNNESKYLALEESNLQEPVTYHSNNAFDIWKKAILNGSLWMIGSGMCGFLIGSLTGAILTDIQCPQSPEASDYTECHDNTWSKAMLYGSCIPAMIGLFAGTAREVIKGYKERRVNSSEAQQEPAHASIV